MLSFLTHPATTAFGLTILHALWQGALIAGLVALLHLRSSSARTRYAVAMIGLFSLPLISVVTFFYYYELVGPGAATAIEPAQWLALLGSDSQQAALDRAGASDWRNLLPYLTIVYCLGLLGFALRLAWGGVRLYLLRHRGLLSVEPSWRQRLADLNRRHDIWPAARMHVSTRVRQVLSFGHFKPLILFPIGVLNRLTLEEVETILLHELAHLKRRDYLWNWLQCVVETTYFFHPAIYWLGVRIRREREYCCDDWVAGRTDRTVYAQSLIHLARFSITSTNQLAMYANDRPALLSSRIERLFQPETRRRSVLPLLLLLIPFLLFAWKPEVPTPSPAKSTASATDNVPTAVDRPVEEVASITTTGVYPIDGQAVSRSRVNRLATADREAVTKGDALAERFGLGARDGVVSVTTGPLRSPVASSGRQLALLHGRPIDRIRSQVTPFQAAVYGPTGRNGAVVIETPSRPDTLIDPHPLFIIDGERFYSNTGQPPTELQPEDIESINVLKGEAAMDAYGLDGKYGVILITTKFGPGNGKKQLATPKPVEPRFGSGITLDEPGALYVIDGAIQFDGARSLEDLDVDDIESINVLKGKAAAEVYGPEFKDRGVIEVFTKGSGKKRGGRDIRVEPSPAPRASSVPDIREVPAPAPQPASVPDIREVPVPAPKPQIGSRIYPNPATGETQFRFRLDTDDAITLTIFDAAGRQVRSQSFGRLPKGEQQLNFNVQDLSPGTYTVIVQASTVRWKASVVRP